MTKIFAKCTNPKQEPPQWALDKAAKAVLPEGYAAVQSIYTSPALYKSVEAHAATLAEYETEPVDPVLLKAREIAAMFCASWQMDRQAKEYKSGLFDDERDMVALQCAIRLGETK